MAKYRKKPVTVDAFQLTKETLQLKQGTEEYFVVDGGIRAIYYHSDHARVDTLEGFMTANVGDYIITGVKGERYPCKPDVFEATYELIEGE